MVINRRVMRGGSQAVEGKVEAGTHQKCMVTSLKYLFDREQEGDRSNRDGAR